MVPSQTREKDPADWQKQPINLKTLTLNLNHPKPSVLLLQVKARLRSHRAWDGHAAATLGKGAYSQALQSSLKGSLT